MPINPINNKGGLLARRVDRLGAVREGIRGIPINPINLINPWPGFRIRHRLSHKRSRASETYPFERFEVCWIPSGRPRLTIVDFMGGVDHLKFAFCDQFAPNLSN